MGTMELESLGTFLKSRRDRTTPERIGLRTFGVTRRVPGLRREELAQLAGATIELVAPSPREQHEAEQPGHCR